MTATCRRCGDTSAAMCEDWDCHLGWPDGPYCELCGIHRVITPGQTCPVCQDEAAKQ